MVSGHTYFTTNYALGLYELVRNHAYGATRKNQRVRVTCITAIVALTVSEQLLEIYVVTLDRFHYTMDVYMALVVTFLIYTNIVPARVAKKWWRFGWHSDDQDPDIWIRKHKSQSEVFVPECCVPFCMFAGREHTFSDVQYIGVINNYLPDAEKEKLAEDCGMSLEEFNYIVRYHERKNSPGKDCIECLRGF